MESVNSANFCLSSDSLGRAAFVSHLTDNKQIWGRQQTQKAKKIAGLWTFAIYILKKYTF